MKNRHVLLIDKNSNTFGNIQDAPTEDINFHFANSINSANVSFPRFFVFQPDGIMPPIRVLADA